MKTKLMITAVAIGLSSIVLGTTRMAYYTGPFPDFDAKTACDYVERHLATNRMDGFSIYSMAAFGTSESHRWSVDVGKRVGGTTNILCQGMSVCSDATISADNIKPCNLPMPVLGAKDVLIYLEKKGYQVNSVFRLEWSGYQSPGWVVYNAGKRQMSSQPVLGDSPGLGIEYVLEKDVLDAKGVAATNIYEGLGMPEQSPQPHKLSDARVRRMQALTLLECELRLKEEGRLDKEREESFKRRIEQLMRANSN